jgi:2-dehydro-3-deoxyphosphogluconate aldolase/(4S)-4-hydroxy-2-oxoglutarate aldolase
MVVPNVFERIGELRIIPTITIENAADATPLADALVLGGLPCAEITFRTAQAEAALRERGFW